MQEKIIEFKYDQADFIETRLIMWRYLFHKHLVTYLLYSLLPVFVLSIHFIWASYDLFSLFTGIGLLIYIASIWFRAYRSRKKIIEQSEKFTESLNNGSTISYKFSEDAFEYQDPTRTHKMNWTLFRSYKLFDDAILLFFKTQKRPAFAIRKATIGEQMFNEVCEILKESIHKPQ